MEVSNESDPSPPSRTLSGKERRPIFAHCYSPRRASIIVCIRSINGFRLQSDYDVCVECGSLAECEHDREVAGTTVPSSLVADVHPLSHDSLPTPNEADYLEMRTVRPVLPFSEVFNTYGSLPNAALLPRYGFILPENEHDTVRMVLDPYSTVKNVFNYLGLDEVSVWADDDAVMEAPTFGGLAIRNTLRVGDFTDHGGADRALIYDKERRQPYSQGIVGERSPRQSQGMGVELLTRNGKHLSEPSTGKNKIDRMLRVFTHVAGTWCSEATWDEEDDGLVFNPQSHATGPVSFLLGSGDASRESVRFGHDLVINSDGKLSHNLWLFCILIAIFATQSQLGPSFEELMTKVERDPEAITSSLTGIKARLINVQGRAEHLRRMEGDGDVDSRASVDGDRMEGVVGGDGGNHESTRSSPSPPLPHLVPTSPNLDYDTESDDFSQLAATVVQEQLPRPRPAGIEPRSASMSLWSTSSSPHSDWNSSAPKLVSGGPQDRAIRSMGFASFSIPQPCTSSAGPMIACHHRATRESYQQQGEKLSPESATSTMMAMRTEPKDVDHGTGYHAHQRGHQWQRDRSPSLVAGAEGERPSKRVRRAECSSSDSVVVVNRENSICCTDRSGRATSESARRRQGHIRQEGQAGAAAASLRDDEDDDATACRLARLLARIVVRLCHDRYRPQTEDDVHGPHVIGMGMTAAQLGDVLDVSVFFPYFTAIFVFLVGFFLEGTRIRMKNIPAGVTLIDGARDDHRGTPWFCPGCIIAAKISTAIMVVSEDVYTDPTTRIDKTRG
ncbi:hypothetical protein JVU11DRAFT_6338 [Chiua virens]|nr:hypothetical protein JVU11DRAFT_6338 [Chiua virens]